jgi:hypothetical protein
MFHGHEKEALRRLGLLQIVTCDDQSIRLSPATGKVPCLYLELPCPERGEFHLGDLIEADHVPFHPAIAQMQAEEGEYLPGLYDLRSLRSGLTIRACHRPSS